ncbi:MAG TPA: hypothetical protein VL359_16920, partial [bacterium]|nr:hypothetical protein [bacterium]
FDPARPAAYPGRVLHWPPGLAQPIMGRLVGGCLSVLVTSLGTPWSIDTRGAILLLEDVDEPPYRLDRLLTHLKAAGKLSTVRAVVWGGLLRCDSDPPGLLETMLRDVFADAPYPVLWGLPCGHGELNLAVPLGALARLERGPAGSATLRVP